MKVHINLHGRGVRVVDHGREEIKRLVANAIGVLSCLQIRSSFGDEMSRYLVIEPDHVSERKQLVCR